MGGDKQLFRFGVIANASLDFLEGRIQFLVSRSERLVAFGCNSNSSKRADKHYGRDQ